MGPVCQRLPEEWVSRGVCVPGSRGLGPPRGAPLSLADRWALAHVAAVCHGVDNMWPEWMPTWTLARLSVAEAKTSSLWLIYLSFWWTWFTMHPTLALLWQVGPACQFHFK